MKKLFVLAAVAALTGCASTSNIDLSKVESSCGRECSKNYSECGSGFTIFPIMKQHQCTEALQLCAQACPPRSAAGS